MFQTSIGIEGSKRTRFKGPNFYGDSIFHVYNYVDLISLQTYRHKVNSENNAQVCIYNIIHVLDCFHKLNNELFCTKLITLRKEDNLSI